MFKVLGFILWVACVIYTIQWIFSDTTEVADEMSESRQEMVDNLRETTVLGKDTLLIVDYSFIEGTYKLSDGSSAPREKVEKGILRPANY